MTIVLVASPSGGATSPDRLDFAGQPVYVVAPKTSQLPGFAHVAAGPDLPDLLDACADMAAECGTSLTLVRATAEAEALITDWLTTVEPTSAAIKENEEREGGDLRVVRGTVVDVGSSVHAITAPTHQFGGVLRVGSVDLATAETAWREMAEVARENNWADVDAVQLALLSLTRFGVRVGGREFDRERRRADAETAELGNGLYTRRALQPLTQWITGRFHRWGVSGETASVLGVSVGLAAALLAAAGTWVALVACAVLIQLWLVLDLVSDEVVTAERDPTALRRWSTSMLHRLREFALVAGLAIGAAVGGANLWPLTFLTAGLLTYIRFATAAHDTLSDSWFDDQPAMRPLDAVQDDATTEVQGLAAPASGRGRGGWLSQLNRFLEEPCSELYLLVSLVMVGWGAQAVLITLVSWSAASIIYTTARRLPGSLRPPVTHRRRLARLQQRLLEQCDPGLLAFLVGREDPHLSLLRRLVSTRIGWFIPGMTWLVEAAALGALVWWREPAALPLAFVALVVVAFHRYDTIYRRRDLDSVAAPWAFFIGLGALGRPMIYLVLAALEVLVAGLTALILVWSVVFAAESASAWAVRPAGAQRPKP